MASMCTARSSAPHCTAHTRVSLRERRRPSETPDESESRLTLLLSGIKVGRFLPRGSVFRPLHQRQPVEDLLAAP